MAATTVAKVDCERVSAAISLSDSTPESCMIQSPGLSGGTWAAAKELNIAFGSHEAIRRLSGIVWDWVHDLTAEVLQNGI